MKTDLEQSLDYLQNKLKEYKDIWIKSSRGHDTGIGHTFEEKVLEKEEDNLACSDLASLEIKSQRMNTASKMTLFTKAPTFPLRANTFIRDNFGVKDEVCDLNIIHTSFFGHRITYYKDRYGFKLEANDELKKVFLKVFNNDGNQLNAEIFWTYSILEDILKTKVKNIGFVEAKAKKENDDEFFKYEKLTILMNPSLKKFIDGIKNGIIQFDIRIGVYRSGKNQGKPHDHGSGYRISKKDFSQLFDTVREINF